MDKAYDHKKFEGEIYKVWEKTMAFKPSEAKEPFSIIMPPPNANGELHLGHATFVAVSDVLIRFNRMMGRSALWLPGIDHAGILAQVSFEKKLQKEQDKSRYDLGREEFVRQCYEFCMTNKSLMENQLKALGASCDWSREKFTLDPAISKLVYETFVKMHKDGLVYRGYRIVNWSTKSRSTLSDLETEEKEQVDDLYYLDYGVATVATTRPETIFADVAVAVNPNDAKMNKLIGQKAVVPICGNQVQIIGDEAVEIGFGTGALKVTPGHDMTDFEIGQRHNLEIKSVIDFDGKMTGDVPSEIKGLKVMEARKKVVEMLQLEGKIVKIEKLKHSVKVSERYGEIIEPLVSRQWFVRIKPLAELAIKAVEEKKVTITPDKYEAMYFNWLKSIRDWPISRQLWWGHQIPVWYRYEDQKSDEQRVEFGKLKNQDSRARVDVLDNPIVSIERPEGDVVQDPDTFDTWFSSGQWPISTLKTSGEEDFAKFFPTSVLNTAYEILFVWVSRMIMFSLYLTGDVPFKTVLINGVLRDETGAKMSKSKGNGLNPNEAIDKYGADAVRMALLAGRETGNDLLISKQQMEERIRGYRNFSNKIWNAVRFVKMLENGEESGQLDDEFNGKLNKITSEVTRLLSEYKVGMAAEKIYDEFWHWFCDIQIEEAKKGNISRKVITEGLNTFVKLLHPFTPFVTEAVWGEMGKSNLINSTWPKA